MSRRFRGWRVVVCLACISVLRPWYYHASAESELPISHKLTRVWGTGIDPRRTRLPIQYVYVQLTDAKGNNYTSSAPDGALHVDLTSPHARIARRSELHYLGGGLYLFRYRIFHEAKAASLSVQIGQTHVADSPYSLGDLLPETCYCPTRTIDEWRSDFSCPTSYYQIDADLSLFNEGGGIDISNLYERLEAQFPRSNVIHYSIVSNKVYARSFGSIIGFKYLSDATLLSLVNKVRLPDLELIVNLSDWPMDSASPSTSPFSVLSWCGSESTRDIIWPTYDLFKSTMTGMERVTLDILSTQKPRSIPWNEREPRAFFRGRDSNRARLELVKLYWNQTELFDVAITAFFFFKADEELYGPKQNRIGFFDFFKYKYQLNIDGTVAAYRLPYLLAGGSLVFKQDSQYYEHFYHDLEPWVHYVPMNENISDVEEKLQWALENDDKAKEIASNSFWFVVDNLLPDKQYCYIYTLLNEYAKLQRGTPRVHPGMEEVLPEELTSKTSCALCSLPSTLQKDEL